MPAQINLMKNISKADIACTICSCIFFFLSLLMLYIGNDMIAIMFAAFSLAGFIIVVGPVECSKCVLRAVLHPYPWHAGGFREIFVIVRLVRKQKRILVFTNFRSTWHETKS